MTRLQQSLGENAPAIETEAQRWIARPMVCQGRATTAVLKPKRYLSLARTFVPIPAFLADLNSGRIED